MPKGLGTPCRYPGCNKVSPYKKRFCEDHQHERSNQRRKHRFNFKKKERLPFYNTKAWLNARNHYIRSHPGCEMCQSPATVVHHKKTARDHPELRVDPDNLQALCESCHNRHSQVEARQERHKKKVEALGFNYDELKQNV